jgi:hypothetical protein
VTSTSTTGVDLTSQGTSHRVSVFLSYAILLGGLLTACAAVYMVIASYSSLPSTDGWAEIDVAVRGVNPLSPASLWQQHNEHRMVIPKLFVAADLLWFRATQKSLLTSILGTQFLLLLLLSWSTRALGGWRGTLWRTGVGIAAFCLFWTSQWENLIIGFSIDFILLGFFATLSFVELVLYWRHSQRRDNWHAWVHLFVSVLAALAATYSLANGNLLWPLLVAAALLLRLRRAAVLTFLLTGALSTALYLHHYHRPVGHGNPASSLQTPFEILHYLAVYFGSPFVRHDIRLATCVGIAGLAAALFVLLRFRAYVRAGRPLPVLLVLLLVFWLGTAFLTSLGRLNFGIRQAFASRYHTFALLFWYCLGLLLLRSASTVNKRARFMVVQVSLLAIIVWSSLITRNDVRAARIRGFRINVAATALFVGARDDVQFTKAAIPDPSAVQAEAEFTQRNELSAYYDHAYTQLGKPLQSVYALASPTECTGVVESTATVEGSGASPVARVAGWAWDREHQRPPSAIVFAQDGVITGLGVVGDWRPMTVVDNRRIKDGYLGYAGYGRVLRPDAPVEVYAILRRQPQSACHFASAGLSGATAIQLHSDVK